MERSGRVRLTNAVRSISPVLLFRIVAREASHMPILIRAGVDVTGVSCGDGLAERTMKEEVCRVPAMRGLGGCGDAARSGLWR